MEVRQQDAIERLTDRSNDFGHFMEYIKDRREVFVQALTLADLPSVEKLQGQIQAFDEVLRIPETAKNEKDARTS